MKIPRGRVVEDRTAVDTYQSRSGSAPIDDARPPRLLRVSHERISAGADAGENASIDDGFDEKEGRT
jgi:hypothetical protein